MNTAAQKCKFQSAHRGMKELNYLLEGFTEKVGAEIWSNPSYQELMALDDIILWEAIMTPQSGLLPDHLVSLVNKIRSTHACAHD